LTNLHLQKKYFQKLLDKHFKVVLKLSTVRRKCGQKFLGDNFLMPQSWIHTNRKTIGFAANNEMRNSRSLSAGVCANFENSDYQPTTGGLDRLGRKI
jgi:hypothetical protein